MAGRQRHVSQRTFTKAFQVSGLILDLVAYCWDLGPGPVSLSYTFSDAGQGDSILIQSPAGVNILVDAGDDQAGTQVVMPYLERLGGLASLDMVVITHPI